MSGEILINNQNNSEYQDRVIDFEGAQVQYGVLSDRVYIMDTGNAAFPDFLINIEEFARGEGLGKIFAKTPLSKSSHFRRQGFRTEGLIPKFYSGKEHGVFMSKFLKPERARSDELDLINEIVSKGAAMKQSLKKLPEGFALQECLREDCENMAEVYRKVFETYPFPIHDPDYLLETMHDNVSYYCVCNENGEIIALSSAEKDLEKNNAEMTDFAALPQSRGMGLAGILLAKMEKCEAAKGIKTAYTIARAVSHGMNFTFARAGYKYGGTLINNTNISGRIESMNLWYKPLG
ncbi:putative beta-lysine N-acetyltransferase [Sedimentisphaera salicampi]|uniref:putative beta-lysine N-acetyltransferase n=1 Tax=Sedimentisphaera salicampi TaxID=1941349 RepID=UPI000B9A57E2|nr:putative beta-lysine N-acetyltransferase [Sedimentisphaera salicampi]OXU14493.1 putative beta-lysine N-acetyltransferase [Sedimentisphaera salicampi]